LRCLEGRLWGNLPHSLIGRVAAGQRGARVAADIEASGGAADFLAADLWALAEARRVADAAQATEPSRSASPGIPRLALCRSTPEPAVSCAAYRESSEQPERSQPTWSEVR